MKKRKRIMGYSTTFPALKHYSLFVRGYIDRKDLAQLDEEDLKPTTKTIYKDDFYENNSK